MRTPTLFRLVVAVVLFAFVAPALPARPSQPARRTPGVHRAVMTASAASSSDEIDRLAMFRDRATRGVERTLPTQVRPAAGRRTGWWGERRRGHIHTGIDFDGETGDPVVAATEGTVSFVGAAPKGFTGYGQIVLIDHDGFQTLYAHLSRIDVALGQLVSAGTGVGAIGTTGSVTGSHLHFEVLVGGKPVDPDTVLDLQ
jgi:murein DD-endopeptidase MepM/ murein hydrolase activator NlpD